MAIMHPMQRKLQARLSEARTFARCWMVVAITLALTMMTFFVKTAVDAAHGTGSPIAASSVPMATICLMFLGAAFVVFTLMSRHQFGVAYSLEAKLERFDRHGTQAIS